MPDGGSATSVDVQVTPTAHPNALKDSLAPTSELAQPADPVAVVLGLSGDGADAVEKLREHYVRLLTTDPKEGAI